MNTPATFQNHNFFSFKANLQFIFGLLALSPYNQTDFNNICRHLGRRSCRPKGPTGLPKSNKIRSLKCGHNSNLHNITSQIPNSYLKPGNTELHSFANYNLLIMDQILSLEVFDFWAKTKSFQRHKHPQFHSVTHSLRQSLRDKKAFWYIYVYPKPNKTLPAISKRYHNLSKHYQILRKLYLNLTKLD